MSPEVANPLSQLVAAVRDLLHLEDLSYADPGERNVVAELFALLRPCFPDHAVSNE